MTATSRTAPVTRRATCCRRPPPPTGSRCCPTARVCGRVSPSPSGCSTRPPTIDRRADGRGSRPGRALPLPLRAHVRLVLHSRSRLLWAEALMSAPARPKGAGADAWIDRIRSQASRQPGGIGDPAGSRTAKLDDVSMPSLVTVSDSQTTMISSAVCTPFAVPLGPSETDGVQPANAAARTTPADTAPRRRRDVLNHRVTAGPLLVCALICKRPAPDTTERGVGAGFAWLPVDH